MTEDEDRVSVRDKYERDEKGESKGKTDEKEEKKGRGKKGGGGDKGGIVKVVISVALVGFGIFVFMETGGISLSSWDRTTSEDYAQFKNSVEKTDRSRKNDYKLDDFYDKNRIYSDTLIKQQVDKEYVVYVYTKNREIDQPYNDWVLDNEKEIPIYKVSISDINTNKELRDYVEDGTPMVVVYNEIDRGVKSLEGVIKEVDLLGEVIPKVEEFREEKVQEREEEKERIIQNKEDRKNGE